MNCSQILYLCRPETTKVMVKSAMLQLWIALKFCIFVVLKQLIIMMILTLHRCELLSNFVSLSSWNNAVRKSLIVAVVVNCSQILYLCRPETTYANIRQKKAGLWIALKFCIFVVLKQPNLAIRDKKPSCELLSNFVSLSSWNNSISLKASSR